MEPANAHPLGWASGPPVGEPLPPSPRQSAIGDHDESEERSLQLIAT